MLYSCNPTGRSVDGNYCCPVSLSIYTQRRTSSSSNNCIDYIPESVCGPFYIILRRLYSRPYIFKYRSNMLNKDGDDRLYPHALCVYMIYIHCWYRLNSYILNCLLVNIYRFRWYYLFSIYSSEHKLLMYIENLFLFFKWMRGWLYPASKHTQHSTSIYKVGRSIEIEFERSSQYVDASSISSNRQREKRYTSYRWYISIVYIAKLKFCFRFLSFYPAQLHVYIKEEKKLFSSFIGNTSCITYCVVSKH